MKGNDNEICRRYKYKDGLILNDSTILINEIDTYMTYKTYHDSVNVVFNYHPLVNISKPDSTKGWYKDKKWYEKMFTKAGNKYLRMNSYLGYLII
ncbi:MAG: hypothetical protein R2771_15680 [Saprospiraceae bacterium]